MIIKFQIYSILHKIPSKGILESHTNVLLNRNRSFKFYFTVFFLVLVREVPSTYLGNASVSPPFPPPKADVVQLKFSEVFRWKDGGFHLPWHALLFFSTCSYFPKSSHGSFSVRLLPGVRTGRSRLVPVRPLTLLGTAGKSTPL